jgi:hypothetical protein
MLSMSRCTFFYLQAVYHWLQHSSIDEAVQKSLLMWHDAPGLQRIAPSNSLCQDHASEPKHGYTAIPIFSFWCPAKAQEVVGECLLACITPTNKDRTSLLSAKVVRHNLWMQTSFISSMHTQTTCADNTDRISLY